MVPYDWELIPDGLGIGPQFRLLFITETQRHATSPRIATYNSLVKAEVHNQGHAAIKPYYSYFSAVGSTPSVDVRVNTGMWDGSAHTDGSTNLNAADGIPIYWLGGEQTVRNYSQFYRTDRGTNNWLSIQARHADGTSPGDLSATVWAFTGSRDEGIASGTNGSLCNTT